MGALLPLRWVPMVERLLTPSAAALPAICLQVRTPIVLRMRKDAETVRPLPLLSPAHHCLRQVLFQKQMLLALELRTEVLRFQQVGV